MPADLAVLIVADAAAWSRWLLRNASCSPGVWLTLAKKNTTEPTSLTYAQALDEALCQGWIDGQARSVDAVTFAHRFTRRTRQSQWSQRNVNHVVRLEQGGRMRPAGREAVEAAKADGRWEAAYAGSASIEPPDELLTAVEAVPKAKTAWDALNRQDRYLICYRLGALKTAAGRRKRIVATVESLSRGETAVSRKNLVSTAGGRVEKPAAARPKQLSGPCRGQRSSPRLK
ncbi:hypothetical protein LTR53_009525 [Teratosphaeriaceae sp. CCFEE 6253]|nr:hypothetical protein LTR53_009525 [Teratosphaeriaceae sp. CCFEE 6253]